MIFAHVLQGRSTSINKMYSYTRFYQVVSFTGICMTFVLLITLIDICISNEGYKRKLDISITNEKKFEMSNDTNFIILLLDAVEARALTALMDSEPEYKVLFRILHIIIILFTRIRLQNVQYYLFFRRLV